MGIFGKIGGAAGGAGNTVLTRMKMDTSQARRELKKLRGEQRKAFKEQLSEMEKTNDSIEKQIKKWAAITAAIVAVDKAWDAASASLVSYRENTRLAAAAGSIDIERLQKASHGLIEETDLLRIAAADQTSAMKLTQQQMENVVGAMSTLINEGRDAESVIRDFTQAVSEESAESLGKFGLNVVNATKGQQAFNRVIEESAKVTERWAENSTTAGAQASVAMADAVDNLKTSIGALVDALGPAINRMAQFVNLLADAGNQWRRALGGDAEGQGISAIKERLETAKKDLARAKNPTSAGNLLTDFVLGASGARNLGGRGDVERLEATVAALENNLAAARNLADSRARAEARRAQIQQGPTLFADSVAAARAAAKGRGGGKGEFDSGFRLGDVGLSGSPGFSFGAGGGLLGSDAGGGFDPGSKAESIRQANALVDTFGGDKADRAVENVVKMSQIASETFAPSMSIMTNAATAAFSAIVTGSESAASAIRKSIGQTLLAEGSRLTGLAVSHGVQAVGSLAIGNFGGAALHGKAAAMAAAGAITMGVLAGQLGVSGGSSAAGKGAVGSVGAGGRAGGPSNQTIIIGDGFDTGSARERAHRVGQWIRNADRDDTTVTAGGFN